METKDIISAVANRLGEHIKKQIEQTLTPLNVLNYMVEKRGAPVLTYEKKFRPNDEWRDECYGVFVTHDEEHLGMTAPAGTGVLMTLEKSCNNDALFSSDARDYLDYYSADKKEYEEQQLNFANHFLGAMGLDYECLKAEIMAEMMKSIAATIPYADMVSAYPMEEVGAYHNGYDGQCYIEDCREADNRRCMTEEELEIEKECRKQREEHERGEREV